MTTTKATVLATAIVAAACSRTAIESPPAPSSSTPAITAPATAPRQSLTPAERLARYTTVTLDPDLSGLSDDQRRMIPLLIEAAKAMDTVYWHQVFGDPGPALASIQQSATRRLFEINYGPWDRLDGNTPFMQGAGPRPAGANYYPRDMSREEFERATATPGPRSDSLKSLYTMVRRGSDGRLVAIPYSTMFRSQHEHAARLLDQAAELAEDDGLRDYLVLRARALRTDEYQPSDFAWMEMKNNTIDVIIGPIETYDDELFGYKAAHETFVLIKDKEWSRRLARYAGLLPELQRGLPVADEYKRESPGTDSELNAYDVVYVSGQANSGAKTIAINLPNDETVQLQKGARRLQLKNAMRAKFDRILVPIARELIVADQIDNVTFDAFFVNVMFHEVAHGLGIKNTINRRGTVREALKELAGALEEGKADILGLYMVRQLRASNELTGGSPEENLVSFLASIFRSVRFGSASAHGRANIAAMNFLERHGAFTRDSTGRYRLNVQRMRDATDALARTILVLQGNGDYAGVETFNREYGQISPTLRADLDRLNARGIPVDIVYDQ